MICQNHELKITPMLVKKSVQKMQLVTTYATKFHMHKKRNVGPVKVLHTKARIAPEPITTCTVELSLMPLAVYLLFTAVIYPVFGMRMRDV